MKTHCRFCFWASFWSYYYTSHEGALRFSVLGFWLFFRSVFRFLSQKTFSFLFWCSLQFAGFPFFSIWFLVFGFRHKYKRVFGFGIRCFCFSYLGSGFSSVLHLSQLYGFTCGFQFWSNFLSGFRGFFSTVLRFLIDPSASVSQVSAEKHRDAHQPLKRVWR